MPEAAAAERTLPHNLEAEKSVLGAILIHNDAFNHAAELIDAHDFFRDAHRRIFNKMVALSERGDAIDLVTLKDELQRSSELEEVGGPAYIASLADGVPRSANVEHYARIVKEKSTLRNLIHSANRILSTAYEAEQDADLILDDAEKAIFEIAEDRIREGFVPLRDLVQSSFATIEKLQQHKGMGSARAARRAGTQPANQPTTTSTVAPITNVLTSCASRPKSSVPTNREAHAASSRPLPNPIASSTIRRRITSRTTDVRSAPSAILIPISARRRLTE